MAPRKLKKETTRSRISSIDPSSDMDIVDDDNYVAHAGNQQRESSKTAAPEDQYDEEDDDDEDDEDNGIGLTVTSSRPGKGGSLGSIGGFFSSSMINNGTDGAVGSAGSDNGEDNNSSIGRNNNSNVKAEQLNADIEREKMNLLLANFNEEQMSRYEAFRRANVNRNAVKKLANAILNQSITPNVAVALSGMSKVFVGEVVERAREVQLRMNPPQSFEEYEQRGAVPLLPEHLREAWRMMKLESGTVPNAHWRRQGGTGDGLMFR